MMRIVTWSRRTETSASSHWLCNNKTEHHERRKGRCQHFGFVLFGHIHASCCSLFAIWSLTLSQDRSLLTSCQAKNDGPHIIKDNKSQEQPEILFFSMTQTEIRLYLVQYMFVCLFELGAVCRSYPNGWIPLGKIWHSCEKTRRRHTREMTEERRWELHLGAAQRNGRDIRRLE